MRSLRMSASLASLAVPPPTLAQAAPPARADHLTPGGALAGAVLLVLFLAFALLFPRPLWRRRKGGR